MEETIIDPERQPEYPGGPDRPFYETWIQAVTSPSVDTYKEIINEPKAGVGRAILWILLSGVVSIVFAMIGQLVFGSMTSLLEGAGADELVTQGVGVVVWAICFIPVAAVFILIWSFIYVGLIHLVAGMLGGTGTFDKLYYAYAAFSSPITMVSSFLSMIPFVGILSAPISLYALVLTVIAVSSSHDLDTGKSVVATLSWVLVSCLCACLVIVLIMITGAAVSDVFTDIINQMQ